MGNFEWILFEVVKFVSTFISLHMVCNQLLLSHLLRRYSEILGCVSVWISKLSIYSRTAFRMRPLGLWVRRSRHFSDVPQGAPDPPVCPWGHRCTLPTDFAPWQADRSFVSCQGLGFWTMRHCPHWQELGFLGNHWWGDSARGKNEQVWRVFLCSWLLGGWGASSGDSGEKGFSWNTVRF